MNVIVGNRLPTVPVQRDLRCDTRALAARSSRGSCGETGVIVELSDEARARLDEAEEEAAPGELDEEERAQVDQLRSRDAEVRAHEQAHVAASGGLAGAPAYTFEGGPDGKRYAVGGHVSIDTSPAGSPEATVAKAQRVQAAAMAPASPSSTDRAVASRAARMASQAAAEQVRQEDDEREDAEASRAAPASSRAYARVADSAPFAGSSVNLAA